MNACFLCTPGSPTNMQNLVHLFIHKVRSRAIRLYQRIQNSTLIFETRLQVQMWNFILFKYSGQGVLITVMNIHRSY